MVIYHYTRESGTFVTPHFELAHHRNTTGNVSAEVVTSKTTPDYYYEVSYVDCPVPVRYYISGRISFCGNDKVQEQLETDWQEQRKFWHQNALRKRIHIPDETN